MEPDYVNGEWGSDGEFYASGERQKRGKKRTKEDNMMGVFGDESDSEEEKRGHRGDPKRPLADKPVAFVSSAKGAAKPAPRKLWQHSQEDAPPTFGGGGAGSRGAATEKDLGLGPTAGLGGHVETGPVERVDKGFAAFESTSRGFGSKMLEKMGWAKGEALGKTKQGIINPIETNVRPNNMGLAYGACVTSPTMISRY